MPETRIKKLCATPSTGHHNVEGSTSRTNNNLVLPVHINAIPIQNQNRYRERDRDRQRGQRNTTQFTASEEMKIKAGDIRIARMQVTMSKLRSEMESSRKLIKELCTLAKIDTEI